jgi:hypothetical protein
LFDPSPPKRRIDGAAVAPCAGKVRVGWQLGAVAGPSSMPTACATAPHDPPMVPDPSSGTVVCPIFCMPGATASTASPVDAPPAPPLYARSLGGLPSPPLSLLPARPRPPAQGAAGNIQGLS